MKRVVLMMAMGLFSMGLSVAAPVHAMTVTQLELTGGAVNYNGKYHEMLDNLLVSAWNNFPGAARNFINLGKGRPADKRNDGKACNRHGAAHDAWAGAFLQPNRLRQITCLAFLMTVHYPVSFSVSG